MQHQAMVDKPSEEAARTDSKEKSLGKTLIQDWHQHCDSDGTEVHLKMSSTPEAEWHDSCAQAINQRQLTEQQQAPDCLYDSNYFQSVQSNQFHRLFVFMADTVRQTREAFK